MRAAIVFVTIVASVFSVLGPLLYFEMPVDDRISFTPGEQHTPDDVTEKRRQQHAVVQRRELVALFAGAAGIVAAAIALRSLGSRRSGVACGLLLTATAVFSIFGVIPLNAILFGLAASLAFLKAYLSPRSSPGPAESSPLASGPTGKAPLQWTLLRILAIFLYLLGAVCLFSFLSWPLFVLWRRYPFPQVIWPAEIGGAVTAVVILALGLLLARRIANRFYGSVAVPKGKFTGHLVLVPLAGMLSWLAIARPDDDEVVAPFLVGAGVLLLVVAAVDALVTLLRYKPFRWHVHVLMGFGAGCAFASLGGLGLFQSFADVATAQRARTFAGTTAEMESRVRYEDLANAVRESKRVRALGDLNGAVAVFDAHVEDHEDAGPCRLTVSPIERHLPQDWLAKDEQSLRLVVVVGPFGVLPSRQLFGQPTWGSPFVVFDRPNGQLIQQGILPALLDARGTPREHYPDSVEGRVCDAAKQLAGQLSRGS